MILSIWNGLDTEKGLKYQTDFDNRKKYGNKKGMSGKKIYSVKNLITV